MIIFKSFKQMSNYMHIFAAQNTDLANVRMQGIPRKDASYSGGRDTFSFMEYKRSLPCSQKLATEPNYKPLTFNPCPHTSLFH
jgi:hypothetical protein